MQKKDLQKQQRRKRKDPQSRDFRCRECDKSYLSYAAVYTHVKNKHDKGKDFQESIIKPQKEKLKRGRPKDKKQIVISSQTHALSICQETTLSIYQLLKEKKDSFSHHIILEGNQQMNQQQFNKEYKKLLQKKSININILKSLEKKQQNKQDISQQIKAFEKFIKGVIKHFSGQIAAKVAYSIQYLLEFYEDINFKQKDQVQQSIEQLDILNMWHGQNKVNLIIYQSMIKWLSLLKTDNSQE